MKKLYHTIESKKDGKVIFNEYVIGVRHMIMIYVEREEKYMLQMRSDDGEAESSKRSNGHEEVWSQLMRYEAIVANVNIVRNER